MGLTDKHLVYGDDIPQTQAEKESYWELENLKEKQQKIGEWIDDADKIDAKFGRHAYKCPGCGKYANYFVGGTEVWWDRIKPNFCPNCGMKGG